MKMILIIEATSRFIDIGLGNENKLLFNHRIENDLSIIKEQLISSYVLQSLKELRKKPKDIKIIAVDIGPGRLTSTRNSVSFANGLAFSLGIPICPFTSFELIGFEAWKLFGLPILCTINSTEGKAYAGLYANDTVLKMKFGGLELITKEITKGIEELVVAGEHINLIQEILNGKKIHNSEITSGHAKTFIEMWPSFKNKIVLYPEIITTINDQSRKLYD